MSDNDEQVLDEARIRVVLKDVAERGLFNGAEDGAYYRGLRLAGVEQGEAATIIVMRRRDFSSTGAADD